MDPNGTDNELSVLLARKAAGELVYEYDPARPEPNTVKAVIG